MILFSRGAAPLMLAVLIAGGCSPQHPPQHQTTWKVTQRDGEGDVVLDRLDEPVKGESATLWVKGMACPQCAYNVDLQLMRVKGVKSVKVDLGQGRVVARLTGEPAPSRGALAQAVADAGLTLERIETP